MDKAQKKAGPPDSLSRKEEKANKRNTNKKRRQDDRKASLGESMPTLKEFLLQESAAMNPNYPSAQRINAQNKECETCGKRTKKGGMRMLKGKESCPACVDKSKA